MLSSIPKGGAVRLPSSSSSSSSSSSRLARRSKRRGARRTNPEKAWSIPSCECVVVLFRGSATALCLLMMVGITLSGARERQEREVRAHRSARAQQRAVRHRHPAPARHSSQHPFCTMLCRAQGSQCCWFILKLNKYLVLTPCAPWWSRACRISPDRRSLAASCAACAWPWGRRARPHSAAVGLRGVCAHPWWSATRTGAHTAAFITSACRPRSLRRGLIIFCASAASSAQACRTARA